MNNILAIDPGDTQSAYVVVDPITRRPVRFAKVENGELHAMLYAGGFDDCTHTSIEMIASYGMPVGASVFDTCVWIGRFFEIARLRHTGVIETVFRKPVKLHHCGSIAAKDPNVVRALVDRFAPGESNYGKGTKGDPGWFHGFVSDIWQAYALGVYVADQMPQPDPVPAPAALSTQGAGTAQGALL